SQVSLLLVSPIERNTARATLTVNGPTASFRRIWASRNCDKFMPMLPRNSGITPRAMVFFVKGRAISSASWASANASQRENLAPTDRAKPRAQDWNGSHLRKLLTELE